MLVVLWLFLGNLRMALIVAAIIPLGLCVSFTGMNWFGVPANLISLGAIDFGLIANAAVIVTENIMQYLERAAPRAARSLFGTQPAEVARAMIFSTAIIIVAYATAVPAGRGRRQDLRADGLHHGLRPARLDLPQHHIHSERRGDACSRARRHCRPPKFVAWMQDGYRRLLAFLIHYPIRLGLVSLVLLVLSVLACDAPGIELPADARGEQSVDPRDAAEHGGL